MKTIYAEIDKRLIESMPQVHFGGRIFTVFTEAECDKAVRQLMDADLIGLDTETRPNFTHGEQACKVSLLQLSTRHTCFLFRLNRIGIPDSLAALLSAKKPLKVGLSMRDDIRALCQRREISIPRYVELQKMVKEIGVQDMSLQKIYANLFGGRISKTQRLSNWESPILTDGQKLYAATDAWACIKIYDQLIRFRTGEEYEYVAPMDDQRMFDIWQSRMFEEIKTLNIEH